METGEGNARDRLLNHARELSRTAPLCGIETADEEVAAHSIAQAVAALSKRHLPPVYFLEETDYLWDVFTECRQRVEAGYDISKGSIGNYAWKCARTAAVRGIPQHDAGKLYGSNGNIYAPEKVLNGPHVNRDGEEYELEVMRDERGQLCQGVPAEEDTTVEGQDVEMAIAALDARSGEIIRYYYYDNLRLKEIGERLRISTARVSVIRRRALETMRRALAGRGEG